MYASPIRVSISDTLKTAVTKDTFTSELLCGRTLAVPLAWYPLMVRTAPVERINWELIDDGEGTRWPELHEDTGAKGLLAGQKSKDSRRPCNQWLDARRGGRELTLYELIAYDNERPRATHAH